LEFTKSFDLYHRYRMIDVIKEVLIIDILAITNSNLVYFALLSLSE